MATNPILSQIERLVADGLHPCAVTIDRVGDAWTSRVMLDDWGDSDELGANLPHHAVSLDRAALPSGVTATDVSRWPDDVLQLPAMSEEQAEAMIAEVARAGLAPDWAARRYRGERWHSWMTKPILWMTEPLRSALLRKHGHDPLYLNPPAHRPKSARLTLDRL